MTPTMQNLERAADELGMARLRKDGALFVKVRPFSTWIKIVDSSWVSTRNLFSPVWLRSLLLFGWVFVCLGYVLTKQFKTHEFTGEMVLLLVVAVFVAIEAAYSPWQARRQKERLFARAAELT
jgi:ABC-type transporter Mla maintaining outer membrane lipid asymmetry permease subunit MlaE